MISSRVYQEEIGICSEERVGRPTEVWRSSGRAGALANSGPLAEDDLPEDVGGQGPLHLGLRHGLGPVDRR